MSELRVNYDLNQVLDTDPDVDKKVAEFLAMVVDFQVPGFGIVHDRSIGVSQDEVHNWHGNLILDAATLLAPELVTGEIFSLTSTIDLDMATLVHIDPIPSIIRAVENQKMLLRLHTTDKDNASHVVLANTAPGINSGIGDRHLYSSKTGLPNDYALARGYDDQPRIMTADLLKNINFGSYDPIVTESAVFHYRQNPLSSVVFRSMSSIGPSTAHGFSPIDETNVERNALVSDLYIFTE